MKSGPSNGKLYTEEDWNTDSEADKEGGYMYSKVSCLSLSSALQVVLSKFVICTANCAVATC